jgi:putative methyltransferase (TIGR04325 family)
MNKKKIHNFVPPVCIRLLSGAFYGWHGNYATWNDAKRKCQGYDSDLLFEKVRASARKVRDHEAKYERDSVLFYEAGYSYPLLSALLWICIRNRGKLHVLDFGGSLGSTYYQNKTILDDIKDLEWCIVEQDDFVRYGQEEFANERLHFFHTVEECTNSMEIDVVLFSSVLQYLEEPFKVIDNVKSTGINYFIIDRTPFIIGKDRITIQRVPPKIYKGSYPCWFFNKEDFINAFSDSFELLLEFDALDKSNIISEFKGFLFRRKPVSRTF